MSIPKYTPTQRFRAVALVLSGCSKNGVCRLTGMTHKGLLGLIRSGVTQREIERLGGPLRFITEYLNDEDAIIIRSNTATYPNQPKPGVKWTFADYLNPDIFK